MNIGFIGFGTMGKPMAEHLRRAGHTLHVWSRRPASTDFLGADVVRCTSPTEVARASEIVCTNVTGSADVDALAVELAAGFSHGSIHVDFSTIAPSTARRIATRYAERDIDFVDAPVSGGGVGAQNASLSIMWGGKSALAERLAPVFGCLGKTIVRVGTVGAGQVAKACNQMVMVAAIEAAAEAAHLAAASGVDFGRVRQAMLGGSAGSRVLDVFGGRMASRDFRAGVEARLHHKDYALLMDEANQLGAPLPITAAVWQQLNAVMAQGYETYDTSALLRVLESTIYPKESEMSVTTASGLIYEDVVVGDGAEASAGQFVSVHYTGWLTNGTKFDSSKDRNEPFDFPLGGRQVIAGWDEGVQGMKIGGTRKLTIPPTLGYGARGAGGVIPPNATLVFEVELLGIE
jgi:2-hydroxy-3-oxopropionate reductase